MNPAAFREIADVIEQADRFDMRILATSDSSDDSWVKPLELWQDCGTAGCVLGWTAAQLDIKNYESVAGLLDASTDELTAAGKRVLKFLGITQIQAERLFLAGAGSVWQQLAGKFKWKNEAWELDNWSAIKAKQAAQVLRMIADGTVTL